ncbi:hypothetical protein GCM10010991_14110 [Gemmobacter aquaticus]|uniref:Uncharacterized protein n=1 Tax=Gemmobacter aquaticus TaxID=490185 RepID=A0A918DCD5_9RHOB|nr:hypothetical protein GCM10010991_14110 [Gemmobacter aquaticus]
MRLTRDQRNERLPADRSSVSQIQEWARAVCERGEERVKQQVGHFWHLFHGYWAIPAMKAHCPSTGNGLVRHAAYTLQNAPKRCAMRLDTAAFSPRLKDNLNM